MIAVRIVKFKKKLDEFEMTSGLLDAVFAHLHISHPDEIEKLKAKVSVAPLSGHWRNIGLNVTLKAHIMEIHVCNLNEKWGIGDK